MSAVSTPWRLLAVYPGKPQQGFPTHFRVENATFPPTEFWDAEYINFSGYFGSHGAAVFAAAPDLLALVIQYRDDLRRPPSPDSVERRLQAVNAAIAKATGQ